MGRMRIGPVVLAGVSLWAGGITEADCAKERGAQWRGRYCEVQGEIGESIRFAVALPAVWNGRSAHMGGGGMNGTIPRLATYAEQGFATYGSDSGHRAGEREWALRDEPIENLGHRQLKKTHDAAMAIIERMYGARPKYRYFFGNSQGGREGLTVAQRYAADYDGVSSHVPIVSFSSLMLAPEWIRIQEKPLENWVTPAKTNAIRAEFLRQCDGLDGLKDGVINHYMACRALFQRREAWAGKRCPGGRDPKPEETGEGACLTDGQIATLRMVYSPYRFATPLANGVKSFGMWLPNTDPAGSGLIAAARFRGQEGAAADAPVHGHLGVLGVTGFLMKDLGANPLDYQEGGKWNRRREELSAILDSTNPDLGEFRRRGGKLIVVIGTNDTLASPGAQLDYYQAVLDKMGRRAVGSFARFFVLPQTGHGLAGKSAIGWAIPNTFDRVGMLVDWVEKGKAPGKSVPVTAGERSLPMCSYPGFPKYVGGAEAAAGSYVCEEAGR